MKCERKIAIGLDASAQPGNGRGVGVEMDARHAGPHHPSVSENVARREAQRFEDMGLGFRSATKNILGHTDPTVSIG